MKLINKLIAFFIGGLFIFSGLIKVNDPVGTAIKLKEYFEVFSADISSVFHIFMPFALPIAVFIVVLEVVLGVALIVGFKTKTVLKALLAMIVFFTFLTFYSAYFNKVTDCGCFGDAIKLTPWESFTKDVVLLVLILVLIAQIKTFSNNAPKIPTFITAGATVLSTFVAIYAILHLPFIDFRPYAVGDNIQQNMKPEETPIMVYIFEKGGKKVESKDWLTEEEGYKYVEAKVLNEDKTIPKITDYSIKNLAGEDFTDYTFEGTKLLVVVENVEKADKEVFGQINTLISKLGKEVEPIAFTSDQANFSKLQQEMNFNIPYFLADATVLKAMIRANPGIMILKDGTVKGKWHSNDVPTAEEVLEKLK
ncbi:MAG: putative membrane protein YphA (DoxX/SURF4 family) [Flammeovirgaceae bacterium]|jgi:uncharacterized membrane protein YphA (DoxX/SURF4 family)